jgi:fructose/tagatose bisphosphate aldolase
MPTQNASGTLLRQVLVTAAVLAIYYFEQRLGAPGLDREAFAEANLPIAVHCEHGDTLELIQQCINDGYTSVMIDGSHHPFEENVKQTADAVKMAHAAGVVVEAELGMLGGIEEDVQLMSKRLGENRIDHMLVDTSQPLDRLLFEYLVRRERMRTVK